MLGKPQTPSKWPSKQHTSKPPCQICHKFGHTAFTCFHQPNLNFQPFPNQSQERILLLLTSAISASQDPNSSSKYQHHPDEGWFMDSGATHHLAHDASSLCNPFPYHGTEQVMVGNGKHIPISHVGVFLLKILSSLSFFKMFFTLLMFQSI